MADDLSGAIGRAKGFLLDQAGREFSETRHEMYFPFEAGFTGPTELQSSDVFARAVLASLLIDIADTADEDMLFRTAIYDIARRESGYIAGKKLEDRAGGWSYFPCLPELPPDVDSLAAAMRLFARTTPECGQLCIEPVSLVLRNCRPDGSLNTWIISPDDPLPMQQTMLRGIDRYWGNTIDPEVCANFYLALSEFNGRQFGEDVLKGARYVLSRQNHNGSWSSTWYWDFAYGMGLCLCLLDKVGIGERAFSAALDFFLDSQREDGGWGGERTSSLETALTVWLLVRFSSDMARPVVTRAVDYLLAQQAPDGSWPSSRWIKMEVGRADNKVSHTLSYQSITLTTAFCLRSLLLFKRSSGLK